MLAIAINDRSATFELIQSATEYVLAVPGPSLVDETMYCGVESMKNVDKAAAMKLEFVQSELVAIPGLKAAIANIEMEKQAQIRTGDHLLVVGEARRFAVNKQKNERPLLSVGPITDGYEVLRKKGIHRLGVVAKGRSM